jgi:uncharacterized protein
VRQLAAALMVGLLIATASASLVQAREPVDYKLMIAAINNGQGEQLQAQLRGRSKQDINLQGRSLLMATAIGSGRPEMVKRLIEWGIDPNRSLQLSDATGAKDITPLVLAVSSNAAMPVIDQLLDLGADLNKASEGTLPLHIALSLGRHRLAQHLLDRGALAHQPEPIAGLTALMQLAVGSKDLPEPQARALLRALLDRGALLNARNSRGSTALHFAAASNNPALVRLLLGAGADPNIRNDRGESPLAAAQRRQQTDLVDILVQAGARP